MMQVDLRALAESQNQFVAHHWYDGLPLEAFGVPMGPVLTYNILQVAGNMWLTHFAALEQAQRKQAEAERAKLDAIAAANPKPDFAVIDNATPALQALAEDMAETAALIAAQTEPQATESASVESDDYWTQRSDSAAAEAMAEGVLGATDTDESEASDGA